MINMHTTDMMTLPTGDVEPANKEMRSATAGASFQSIVAADDSVVEPQIDGLAPSLMNGELQEKPDHFTSRFIFSTDAALLEGITLPESETGLLVKTDLIDEDVLVPVLAEMISQSAQAIRPTFQGQRTSEMILDTKETSTKVVVPEAEEQREPAMIAKADRAVDEQRTTAPLVGQQITQKIFPQAEGIQQNIAAATYNQTSNIQPSTRVELQADSSISIPSNSTKQPASPIQYLSQSNAPLPNQGSSQAAQSQAETVDQVYDTSLSRTTGFAAGTAQRITDKSASTALLASTAAGGGFPQALSATSANLVTPMNGAAAQTKLSDNTAATTALPIKQARNAATESNPASKPTEIAAPTSTVLQPNELTQQPSLRQIQKANQPKENDQSVEASKANAEVQNSRAQNTTISQAPLPAQNVEVSQNVAADLTAGPDLMPLEIQNIDGPTATRQDTALNRPEVMRHVAQQMANVARQSPDRPVELILNPEELGRVRLTFTTTDGGINVAVFAERGETIELLRRHIETLAQEFRELGYKDVSFDFSGNGAGRDQNETNEENADQTKTANQNASPTETVAPVQLSLDPSKGLDLRL